MKIFILMHKQIFKKPIGLILVALQVAFALLILNVSIGKIYYLKYTTQIFTDKGSENSYVLWISDISDRLIRDANERISAGKAKLKGIVNTPGVEYMFDMQYLPIYISHNDDKIRSNAITYPRNDFKYKPVLQYGKWIEDVKLEDDIYPAVISSDLIKYFKIGDRFSATVLGRQYKFEVCGVLKKPNLVLHFNVGGSQLNWSNLFEEYENIILTNHIIDKNSVNENRNYGNAADELDSYLLVGRPTSVVVKLEDNLSDEEKKKTLSNLLNYGSLLSFEEINETTRELIRDKTIKYTINYSLLIIMGLMGIIGVSVLNSIKELSVYSIWYLCGSKWRNIFALNFLRIFSVLLISVLLNIIILSRKYVQENFFYNSLLSIKHYIITGIMLVAILLICNGVVFHALSMNTPVDILRRYQKE